MSKQLVANYSLDPAQLTIALIGNTNVSAAAIGYWDMWITMNGGMAFAPVHMDAEFHASEVQMADFIQTMKINKSDTVVVVLDGSGKVENYMIALINHAFAKRIPVYTDAPLAGIQQEKVTLKSTQLLRELQFYKLTRRLFEKHLDHLDEPTEVIDAEELSVGDAIREAAKEPVPPKAPIPITTSRAVVSHVGIATPPRPPAA